MPHDLDKCPACESISPSLIGSINTPEGPQLCSDPFHITRASLSPQTPGLIPGQVTYQPPNAHVQDYGIKPGHPEDVMKANPLREGMRPCPWCGAPTPEYAMCTATERCRFEGEIWLRARQQLISNNPIIEFGDSPLFITRHMTIEISDDQARALSELLAKLPEVNRKAVEARSRRNDAQRMIHISEDDFKTLIQQHRPLGHITSTHGPGYLCSCQFSDSKAHKPTKLIHLGPESNWLTHFIALLNISFYHPSNIEPEQEEARTGKPVDGDK